MKVLIDQIKFEKDIYPRFQADNYTVNQYRLCIDQLPPITLTKDNVLIDGYHRLLAHKLEGLKEIEVEFVETTDHLELLLESIRRNSSHGKQLSIDEKRASSLKLYKAGITDLDKIALILSVTRQSVSNWTKDIRQEAKEKRNIEILELYLQCWTQEEIADKLGITQPSVSNILIKNEKLCKIYTPDNLQLYNVWSVGKLGSDQLKYPGQTPLEVVENLVYYYTPPPQLNPLNLAKVVDPMAGSGIIRDACRKLLCRYMLFDLEPLREDIPIEKNDVLQGFPDKAKGANLVYFDPPYYNLMDKYPNNHFNESYESFLGAMKISLENILTILNDKGKVALILKPMNVEMLGGDWLDMTIDCVDISKELGYKLIKRISAPLSTQQFEAHDVTQAKERGVMLNTLRDIVILQKGD